MATHKSYIYNDMNCTNPLRCALSLPAVALLISVLFSPAQLHGQFLEQWQARVTQTQAEQPHWVTPLATVTPRLEQEFRFDVSRQCTPAGEDLVNLGGGKGLELIPSRNIEIIVAAPPPYLIHHDPAAKDGFGDESFLLKYRVLHQLPVPAQRSSVLLLYASWRHDRPALRPLADRRGC